jgi:antitoxin MazE
MQSHVKKWGNSQGLRLPQELLRKVNLAVGDEVEISVEDQKLVITKSRRRRSLDDLLALMPDDYQTTEEDLGPPVGLEEW